MASQNSCGASCNIFISAEFNDSIVPEGLAVPLYAFFCFPVGLGLKEYCGVGGCSGAVTTSGNVVCLVEFSNVH